MAGKREQAKEWGMRYLSLVEVKKDCLIAVLVALENHDDENANMTVFQLAKKIHELLEWQKEPPYK